jgi:hypothetical protein
MVERVVADHGRIDVLFTSALLGVSLCRLAAPLALPSPCAAV